MVKMKKRKECLIPFIHNIGTNEWKGVLFDETGIVFEM